MSLPIPAEWPHYQISFLLNNHRYQQDVRCPEDRANAFFERLENGKDALQKLGVSTMDLQDLQVYLLDRDKDRYDESSAYGLLETLTDAVSINLESPEDLEEEPEVAKLIVLAKTLDVAFEGTPKDQLLSVQMDFTWDNGGGDDNAFTDGYAAPVNMRKERKAFEEALGDWLETGHGYDVCFKNIANETDETMDLLSGVRDLIETLKENYEGTDGLPVRWIEVMENTLIAEEAISLEQETLAASGDIPATRKNRKARP